MCRSIRKLRDPQGLPSRQELADAALQFVRKISGYRVPSRKNEKAFQQAVTEITDASRRLFAALKRT